MKIFTRPLNLNGKELKEELAEVGIFVDLVSDLADGTIGFLTDNEELAASIVAAHNGTVQHNLEGQFLKIMLEAVWLPRR